MLNYNFREFNVGVSKDFEVASAGTTFNYSDDFFGGVVEAYYWDFGVEVSLRHKFTIAGHVGLQNFDDGSQDDYVDWSVGIFRPIKGIDVSLTYYDTDIDAGGFCGVSTEIAANALSLLSRRRSRGGLKTGFPGQRAGTQFGHVRTGRNEAPNYATAFPGSNPTAAAPAQRAR